MLKGIPNILSPQLLKILCEMGHGDRIIITTSEPALYANIMLQKGVVTQ